MATRWIPDRPYFPPTPWSYEPWLPGGGGGLTYDLNRAARMGGSPFPSFIGAAPAGQQPFPLVSTGPGVYADVTYTLPPRYGEVIPRPRRDLETSASFPRDPSSGAALPNASDPILAGSRYDPFGFTIPKLPPWQELAEEGETFLARRGLALRVLDTLGRTAWGGRSFVAATVPVGW